jgi:hypothetical protein
MTRLKEMTFLGQPKQQNENPPTSGARSFLFRIDNHDEGKQHHVMEVSGDEIADVVLKNFESWEKKRKPQVRTNGVREWVPLSSIVAQGIPLRYMVQIFILTYSVGKNGLSCLASAYVYPCLLNIYKFADFGQDRNEMSSSKEHLSGARRGVT